MTEPQLTLVLDDRSRVFQPRDGLAGHFRLEGVAGNEVRAVEVSVLWHTEGKGDEDMSVHSFERIEPAGGECLDFRQPRRFASVLPNSPLSYEGVIVKIRWCVRVRVFLDRGKELSAEEPFQLGRIPHADLVMP